METIEWLNAPDKKQWEEKMTLQKLEFAIKCEECEFFGSGYEQGEYYQFCSALENRILNSSMVEYWIRPTDCPLRGTENVNT